MIISPPRVVGTKTVARMLGCNIERVTERVRNSDPLLAHGYLGKISNRHTWNLHELCASLFVDDAHIGTIVDRIDRGRRDPLDTLLCGTPDCDQPEEMIGLCVKHLRRLMNRWKRAGRSTLVAAQLVAMCQWVVDRNAHIVFPDGFDPWSTQCMTPGCENETNHGGWAGPLCTSCSAAFWNNAPERDRPHFWKQTA